MPLPKKSFFDSSNDASGLVLAQPIACHLIEGWSLDTKKSGKGFVGTDVHRLDYPPSNLILQRLDVHVRLLLPLHDLVRPDLLVLLVNDLLRKDLQHEACFVHRDMPNCRNDDDHNLVLKTTVPGSFYSPKTKNEKDWRPSSPFLHKRPLMGT